MNEHHEIKEELLKYMSDVEEVQIRLKVKDENGNVPRAGASRQRLYSTAPSLCVKRARLTLPGDGGDGGFIH